jgi:hypothetical protein
MIFLSRIHRLSTASFGALASLCLIACMSGTGTDTENGVQVTARFVGADGAPMARVEVQVNSLYASPDRKADSPLMPGTDILRTDSAGYVRFRVKRAGQYLAQGKRADTVMVLDTLTAAQTDSLNVVFHASPVQRLRGKVRLYSGYQLDTGLVFLRGSSVSAPVSRGGNYDFGYVPVSAGRLTLGTRYASRPASKVFVRMAEAGAVPVIDSRFSLDSTLIPGTGANLTLLKAAETATNVCLESVTATVVPGVTLKGSVGNTNDVMRAASFACSDKIGADIQVDKSDLAGRPLKKLGSYVLPDASIWPQIYRVLHGLTSQAKGQKIVVPASCLQDGATTNYTTGLSAATDGTEIRVDDIRLASGCDY